MRLRPSCPTARSFSRSSDRALRSSRSGADSWIGLGDLAERVVVEVEPAALEPRPGDAVRAPDSALEAVDLERAAVVDAVVAVDLGDQRVLDAAPVLAQQLAASARRSARRRAPWRRRRPCSGRAAGRAAGRCCGSIAGSRRASASTSLSQ